VEQWEDKKGLEPFSPQNNLIQDSEGNKENGHKVLDSNKAKINDANIIIYHLSMIKEPNNAHKNTLKKEILQGITDNFMEMLIAMVNKNIQEALKKYLDTKNKEYKKTQKQINELTGGPK
jgi:hypothetical protein